MNAFRSKYKISLRCSRMCQRPQLFCSRNCDAWPQSQTSGLEYCVRVNLDTSLPLDEIPGGKRMGTTTMQICSYQKTLFEAQTSDGHLISHDIDRR